jgi:hypothetical protein
LAMGFVQKFSCQSRHPPSPGAVKVILEKVAEFTEDDVRHWAFGPTCLEAMCTVIRCHCVQTWSREAAEHFVTPFAIECLKIAIDKTEKEKALVFAACESLVKVIPESRELFKRNGLLRQEETSESTCLVA